VLFDFLDDRLRAIFGTAPATFCGGPNSVGYIGAQAVQIGAQ
jgi:hypothetical protein